MEGLSRRGAGIHDQGGGRRKQLEHPAPLHTCPVNTLSGSADCLFSVGGGSQVPTPDRRVAQQQSGFLSWPSPPIGSIWLLLWRGISSLFAQIHHTHEGSTDVRSYGRGVVAWAHKGRP